MAQPGFAAPSQAGSAAGPAVTAQQVGADGVVRSTEPAAPRTVAQLVAAVMGVKRYGSKLSTLAAALGLDKADAMAEIRPKQLKDSLKEMGVGVSDPEVKVLFKTMDADRSGTVHYGELEQLFIAANGHTATNIMETKHHLGFQLLLAVHSHRSLFGTELTSLADAFAAMDLDGDLQVSLPEFAAANKRLGLGLQAGQLTELFRVLDKDGSGTLSFCEVETLIVEARAKAKEKQPRSLQPQQAVNRRGRPDATKKEALMALQTVARQCMSGVRSGRSLFGAKLVSLYDAFLVMDRDGDVRLSREELANGLQRLGVVADEDDVGLIFAYADREYQGKLPFEYLENTVINSKAMLFKQVGRRGSMMIVAEDSQQQTAQIDGSTRMAIGNQLLMALTSKRLLFGHTLDTLSKTFDAMDRDGNGTINLDEFRNALGRLGTGMSTQQVTSLFKECDTSNDGRLDLHELEALFVQTKALVEAGATHTPTTPAYATKQERVTRRRSSHASVSSLTSQRMSAFMESVSEEHVGSTANVHNIRNGESVPAAAPGSASSKLQYELTFPRAAEVDLGLALFRKDKSPWACCYFDAPDPDADKHAVAWATKGEDEGAGPAEGAEAAEAAETVTVDTSLLPPDVAYAMVYMTCVDGGIDALQGVVLRVCRIDAAGATCIGTFHPPLAEAENKLGLILATQKHKKETGWEVHFQTHAGDIFFDYMNAAQDDLSATFAAALESEDKEAGGPEDAAQPPPAEGDTADKVLVERNGKFVWVDADEMIDFDHLQLDAEPAPPPPDTAAEAAAKVKPRAKSAHPAPRAAENAPRPPRAQTARTARSAGPGDSQKTFGHTDGFKGPPGYKLTRFTTADARDAYEAWYKKKQRAPSKRKGQAEDQPATKAQDNAAFQAWCREKDRKEAEKRKSAKKFVEDAKSEPSTGDDSKAAYLAWVAAKKKKRLREKSARSKHEQGLSGMLSPAVVETKNTQAFEEWRRTKRHQEKAERLKMRRLIQQNTDEARRIKHKLQMYGAPKPKPPVYAKPRPAQSKQVRRPVDPPSPPRYSDGSVVYEISAISEGSKRTPAQSAYGGGRPKSSRPARPQAGGLGRASRPRSSRPHDHRELPHASARPASARLPGVHASLG